MDTENRGLDLEKELTCSVSLTWPPSHLSVPRPRTSCPPGATLRNVTDLFYSF